VARTWPSSSGGGKKLDTFREREVRTRMSALIRLIDRYGFINVRVRLFWARETTTARHS
jgi:hypothetical protein